MPDQSIIQPVAHRDITMKINADFRLSLCVKQPDENGNLVAVDTTGWAVEMDVRPEPDPDSTLIVSAATANGRIVVGIQGTAPDQVNIDVKIPQSVTAGITHTGAAGYDLRVTYPDGNVDYLLEGWCYLQPAYTW